MPEELKESIILPNYKKGDKTDCCNYRSILILLTTYIILSNNLLSRLIPYAEEILGIINMGMEAIDQLVIIYPAFVKNLRKTEEYNDVVY